jgi:hypothetical protein
MASCSLSNCKDAILAIYLQDIFRALFQRSYDFGFRTNIGLSVFAIRSISVVHIPDKRGRFPFAKHGSASTSNHTLWLLPPYLYLWESSILGHFEVFSKLARLQMRRHRSSPSRSPHCAHFCSLIKLLSKHNATLFCRCSAFAFGTARQFHTLQPRDRLSQPCSHHQPTRARQIKSNMSVSLFSSRLSFTSPKSPAAAHPNSFSVPWPLRHTQGDCVWSHLCGETSISGACCPSRI